MEITQKGRYLCRVQIIENNEIKVKAWVEEANLLRDVYDRIQAKYGFKNDLDSYDDGILKQGVRGVRLINGELV